MRVTWQRIAAAVALTLAARTAEAAIAFEAANGWQVSFDGFVNAFGVNESGSRAPANAVPDVLLTDHENNEFRLRTGLLPGLFGFNVVAPKVDGLEVKGRIGLYPQINNSNTRNAFGSQIDLREIYFTVDGAFGQVLAGRALNLFQGKNILTDMTLFGVGAQANAAAPGGTTLGRIGYGYLYTQFGAQLRYTTPDLSGVKLALAVVDPSQIAGSGVAATVTKSPGFEGELSYAKKLGEVQLQAWVSGLYQEAWDAAGTNKVASGVAAGVGTSFARVELLASGFVGKGLGTFLMLDVDSLDRTGEERESAGFLAQAAYTLGSTKLGLSYGQNSVQETAAEKSDRLDTGLPSGLETRSSITAGLYHDLNKHLKVAAEYTRAMADWFDGQDQAVDVVALGGFFMW